MTTPELQAESYGARYSQTLAHFDRAATYLKLPDDLRSALRQPAVELHWDFAVPMDNGALRMFTGYGVQHYGALRRSLSGVRYGPDLDLDALRAQALLAAWQSALVNLPDPGLTRGVLCDVGALSLVELDRLARRFASLMDAPDTAPSTPNSESLPAIWPDPAGWATGQGAAICLDIAVRDHRASLPERMRVAILGASEIGVGAARTARALGYRVIGTSHAAAGPGDHRDRYPLSLFTHARAAHTPSHSPAGIIAVRGKDLPELDVDAMILCAPQALLTDSLAARVRARWIVEAVTGTIQPAAEALLATRGITIVPDLLARAGGALAAYFTWVQRMQAHTWSADEVLRQLGRALERAYAIVRREQTACAVDLRTAAQIVAVRRLAARRVAFNPTL